MKLLFGLFLVAHGLLHISYLLPKPDDPTYPFDFTKGWFARTSSGIAKPIGTVLAIVTATSFMLAGLGVFGMPGLDGIWEGLAIGGAVTSIALLGLFWQRWLVMGVVIDLVLLYGLMTQNWTWVS